jgi:hypothetical protein
VQEARAVLTAARLEERRAAQEEYEAVLADVEAQVQSEVAREFDTVHSVARALEVGSLDAIARAQDLRPALCERLQQAIESTRGPAKMRAFS